MTNAISIGERTDAAEISEWLRSIGDVEFVLSAKSGFEFATHALAVSAVHSIIARGQKVTFRTTFDAASAIERGDTILASMFGVALLARGQMVDGRAARAQHGEQLFQHMWDKILHNGGRLGSGIRTYVFCRDPDMPLPEAFRGGVGARRFPLRQRFAHVLAEERRSILGSPSASTDHQSAEDLTTFLYEAAKNAHEHGFEDKNGRLVRGIRGIVSEKLVLNQVSEVSRLSSALQEYVKRTKAATLLAYSVIDNGVGIHSTLPPILNKPESPIDTLNRAFMDGQTRKARGMEIDAGLGLGKLRDACIRTKSHLAVKSGDLLADRDCSVFVDSTLPFLSKRIDVDLRGSTGTCVTLITPDLVAAKVNKQLGMV